MRIYQHRDTVTASAGSTSSVSMKIVGGLCRQFAVIANTASTVFKANLVDYKEFPILDYGFHTGTLNDYQLYVPVDGAYTINITNASPDDTFKIYMGVQE
jgi:hypothetical protein